MYEFPTGQNALFGSERFRVGELFFIHEPTLQAANPSVPLPLPLPGLIAASLGACDPDLRQQLIGNIVLTGGGSQFSGLTERLNNELGRQFPGVSIQCSIYDRGLLIIF
jgi:actin-like protein 6B